MSENNAQTTELENRKKISSLTISELFLMLKPAQLWTIITIIVAVLSGSFGLGYKLNDHVAQSREIQFQQNIDSLEKKIVQFRAIQAKERFLALYLNYFIAKEKVGSSPTVNNQNMLEETRDGFISYIESMLRRGEEAAGEIDLRGLFIGKGAGGKATVKFGYDGTVWPVPAEFGFHAAAK